MKRLKVFFYKSSTGKEPVRDFIKGMSKKDKAILGEDIKTVECGWPIGMPVCKPMGNKLFEIRSTNSQSLQVRILSTIKEDEMILLHAFVKKSQKTPKKELEIAYKRKSEVYNER